MVFTPNILTVFGVIICDRCYTSQMSAIQNTKRIYNFSAGPAVLPLAVLEEARDNLLSLDGAGMSVMEISHRSSLFENILQEAGNGIRELLGLPPDYKVLFLQGGAAFQFSMVPLNFLTNGLAADYVVTGTWGEKAVKEARRCGPVNVIFDGKDAGYRNVPSQSELRFSQEPAYVHYRCS